MSRTTKLFFAVLIFFACLQLGKLIYPAPYIKQFHLTSDNFPTWSLFQALPSMYNYSNGVWISREPYDHFTVEEIIARELEHVEEQMNHYPVRVFTFRQDRDKIFEERVKTVYVRSVFGGEIHISAYEVEIVNGKAKVHLREVYVK